VDVAPGLPVITQTFGCTDFPEYRAWCQNFTHYGIDLSSGDAWNQPQYATRDGIVRLAGPGVAPGQPGLGTAVVVSCDEGVDMLYGHLGTVAVQADQRVSPGIVIGYTGSTGYSTGPHAHIEVRQRGYLNAGAAGVVDPWPYLTFAGGDELNDEERTALFQTLTWAQWSQQKAEEARGTAAAALQWAQWSQQKAHECLLAIWQIQMWANEVSKELNVPPVPPLSTDPAGAQLPGPEPVIPQASTTAPEPQAPPL
jgi:hypothetical protein